MIRSAVHILRRHLTPKRAANIAQVLSSYIISRIIRRPIVFGRPFILMVEPTNLCNLHCPLCPTGSDLLTRLRGKMDFEPYARLIDEVGEYLLYLSLWNVGEPFLNEHLIDMIRYAKKRNIYVITSTNGHFFGKKRVVDDLVLSGLDELIVSMDGASPETYNHYRRNGQFQKVVDGLGLLIQERAQQGRKRPLIDLQFIVMRHNEHELERMVSLAQELNVDRLTLKTVQVTSQSEAEEFLPVREELRRYLYCNGNLRMKGRPKNNCRWLWFSSVINWDGTIVPCCFDKDNDFLLGTVNEDTTLPDIWHGGAYNGLRQNILTDRKRIGLCTNCSEGLKSLYLKRVRLR